MGSLAFYLMGKSKIQLERCMKKTLVISFLALIIFLLPVKSCFSTIINGSFESGYDGLSIDIKFRNWFPEEPPSPLDPAGNQCV